MRKIFFLLLAFFLTACAAQPVTPIIIATGKPIGVSPTPKIMVQTVIVTVIVTSMPPEIPSSTATAQPKRTKVPTTRTAETQLPASSETSAALESADSILVTLDQALGGGFFSPMALTGKFLSLRCETTRQITFNVTPSDPTITQVDFYYRIEDPATNIIFDWQGPRRMIPAADGSFSLMFTGEEVNSSFRIPNAWFDFQFVGLDKSLSRVGNSEKIVQQVRYTLDCP